jgi:hydrogenase maturation factor
LLLKKDKSILVFDSKNEGEAIMIVWSNGAKKSEKFINASKYLKSFKTIGYSLDQRGKGLYC